MKGNHIGPVVSQAQRNLKVEDPNSPELELLDFFYVSQWMQDWQLRQGVLDEEFLRLAADAGMVLLRLTDGAHNVVTLDLSSN